MKADIYVKLLREGEEILIPSHNILYISLINHRIKLESIDGTEYTYSGEDADYLYELFTYDLIENVDKVCISLPIDKSVKKINFFSKLKLKFKKNGKSRNQ